VFYFYLLFSRYFGITKYFKDFDKFYEAIFDSTKMDMAVAQDIYNNNKDLEPLDLQLIQPTEDESIKEGILEEAKSFWESWREPKKTKL